MDPEHSFRIILDSGRIVVDKSMAQQAPSTAIMEVKTSPDLFACAKVLSTSITPKQRKPFLSLGRRFGEVFLGKEVENILVRQCLIDKAQAGLVASMLLNARILHRVSKKRDKLRALLSTQSGVFKGGNRFYRFASEVPERIVTFSCQARRVFANGEVDKAINPGGDFHLTIQVDQQFIESKEHTGLNSEWNDDFNFVVHPSMHNARIEIALWTKVKRKTLTIAHKVSNLETFLSNIQAAKAGNSSVVTLGLRRVITEYTGTPPTCNFMVELKVQVNQNMNASSAGGMSDSMEEFDEGIERLLEAVAPRAKKGETGVSPSLSPIKVDLSRPSVVKNLSPVSVRRIRSRKASVDESPVRGSVSTHSKSVPRLWRPKYSMSAEIDKAKERGSTRSSTFSRLFGVLLMIAMAAIAIYASYLIEPQGKEA